MKTEIALSIKQMRELKSLGLDCSDASMAWGWFQRGNERWLTAIARDKELPNAISQAYTLEDIIFKLEADITYNVAIANKPDTFAGQPVEKTPWECNYSHLVGFAALEHTLCCGLCWGKTPMEAAFNALKEVQECFPDKIKRL